jgi:gamma-glutamyltranspeptidase
MLKEGDLIKFPELAETYKTLAENGGQAFYNVSEGSLGYDILQDLKEKSKCAYRMLHPKGCILYIF